MKALAFLLSLSIILSGTGFACTAECPDGYLAVCVRKGDEECKCRCVEDADDGATELRTLLEAFDPPAEKIEEAVQRYRNFIDQGEVNFSFIVEYDEVSLSVFVSSESEIGVVEEGRQTGVQGQR